ncbi:MAG: hypothetical protein IRZ07_29520, partial [Microbispora sp.]|nr:hypothetical protein [Microbispora sp.]
MRITAVESTELFVRAAAGEAPRQVVRVALAEVPDGASPEIEITGPGVRGGHTASGRPPGLAPEEPLVAEVPVTVEGSKDATESAVVPGVRVPITVRAAAGRERCTAEGELIVAEPGWTVWMIPH